MPETDPTIDRCYLADANYHRLGYQLAAQLMHRESSGRALREATRFAADAEAVLAWYRHRRETKKWLFFRHSFTSKEERLEEFLERTVLPCLTIVIAASLRRTDPTAAEEKIAPLRRRAEMREEAAKHLETVSYRTLYNLACYEAGGDDDTSQTKAVAYLAAALDRAKGNRRGELGRWAGNDPSLEPLKKVKGFEELVKPYKKPVEPRE